MSVSLEYTWIGKWIDVDGSLFQYYYWEDFNPTNKTRPTSWETCEAYEPTSTFDLDWFQPWHEVGCGIFILNNDWDSNATFTMSWSFQRLKNWTWSTSWTYWWTSKTIKAHDRYAGYMYFGIDDDEIWSWYTSYRIRWIWAASTWDTWEVYSNFYVSNMDIDSSLYPSGCLRVDWSHLCYTDWTWWGEWYIHKIAYDSNVYQYVGTEYKGYIWMEDSWATAMKHIYYITEYGYKTRTYWYQQRYWGNRNVWTRYAWSIWIPTWDETYWYGHLCYVTAEGQKLRVLNWPPAWYV